MIGVSLLGFCGCAIDSESVERLVITGSSTVAPLAADIAKMYESENPLSRIEIQTGGSSRGIADAKSGLANIGMSSRELNSGEVGLRTHPIAIDGLALIIHAENPVKNITLPELASIYTGKTGKWSEIGGDDRGIVVVNKAEGRGTLEVFLKSTELDSADIKADLIVGENQQAIKTVAGNRDAIGYVSIGSANYEIKNGSPIKILTVEGIETLASRDLYFVTCGEPGSLEKSFIDFAQSPRASHLIERHFYVPFSD